MSNGDPASDRSRRREGIVALLFVQLFFGLFPLFVKFANDPEGGFSPRTVAFWRMIVGSVVLGAGALWLHGREIWPQRSDWARLLVCAALGIAINQVFALEGMARTSVVDAGLLFTTIPVFTYALAVLVRQEPMMPGRVLGILIACAGAGVLVLQGGEGVVVQDSRQRLLGNVFIVLNCFSYAVYLILARRLLQRYPPLVVSFWVFLLSLWTLPFVIWGQELWPAEPTQRALVGMAYTLVFPTAVAYFLNAFALARVSSSTTAAFIYLQPLVAGASAVALNGERVGAKALVAAVLIFVGLGLVLRKPVRG